MLLLLVRSGRRIGALIERLGAREASRGGGFASDGRAESFGGRTAVIISGRFIFRIRERLKEPLLASADNAHADEKQETEAEEGAANELERQRELRAHRDRLESLLVEHIAAQQGEHVAVEGQITVLGVPKAGKGCGGCVSRVTIAAEGGALFEGARRKGRAAVVDIGSALDDGIGLEDKSAGHADCGSQIRAVQARMERRTGEDFLGLCEAEGRIPVANREERSADLSS